MVDSFAHECRIHHNRGYIPTRASASAPTKPNALIARYPFSLPVYARRFPIVWQTVFGACAELVSETQSARSVREALGNPAIQYVFGVSQRATFKLT